ncbi:MAG: alpha/beta hydrolase [Actinomycetota bacterium]|nr:alpha/beta hydrolase [Actinomycetota bacterium]
MQSITKSVSHPVVGTELVRDWIPSGELRAVAVVVHGLFEHSGRYELLGSMVSDAGIHVRSFDLLGGGATGGRRWDTPDWEEFHDQLQTHMEWALDQGPPVVLIGHSTGGTISLSYVLEERPKPQMLVLSSPLIEVRRTWQQMILPVLARIAPRMHIPSPVKKEDLSRNPEVGEEYLADPLVYPVATPRFGAALNDEMDRLQNLMHDPGMPTLVFHGGQDSIVPPQGSAHLADLPSVERKLYPTLRHETMHEPEGPQVVADVIDWINARI